MSDFSAEANEVRDSIKAHVDKHKPWNKLSTAERIPWDNRARDILFPDLRTGYELQPYILSEIAKGLYKAYVYSLYGEQPEQKSVLSMLDATDNELERFNVTPR